MAGWDDENGVEDSDIQTSTSTVIDDQNTQLSIEPSVIDEPLSNEDFVKQAYQDLFGREADEAGASWWSGVLNSGGSRQDVISAFENSDEYKALHAAIVASTPESPPQVEQLELWSLQPVSESAQVVSPSLPQETQPFPPLYVSPSLPPAQADPIASIDDKAPQEQLNDGNLSLEDLVGKEPISAAMSGSESPTVVPPAAPPAEEIPSYNEMAKSYDSLTDQFTTLSQNGSDKYNELQRVLQTQGANSAAAIAMQAQYDQIISAQNVVIASLDQVDAQIWAAVEQKQSEATRLHEQYQAVAQTQGEKSLEAKQLHEAYIAAQATTSGGELSDLLNRYHERHRYDQGSQHDQQPQGQSTGSGIMEDILIGLGLVTLSSSAFRNATMAYEAPREVGHYADPSAGQTSEPVDNRPALNHQNDSHSTGQPSTNNSPQEIRPQEPANSQQAQAEGGGNGGWAGVAGGMFYDGMDSSGGESEFGAGSNYMNNSNDSTAGGDLNIQHLQDPGNEGQGPQSGGNNYDNLADAMANSDYIPPSADYNDSDPTIAAEDFSTDGRDEEALSTAVEQQNNLFQQLEQTHAEYQRAVETFGPDSIQAQESASTFEHLNQEYNTATDRRNEIETATVAINGPRVQPATEASSDFSIHADGSVTMNAADYSNISNAPLAPQSVPVQSGMNASKIADHYGTTVEDIRRMNPDVDLNHLQPGQVLTVQPFSVYDRSNDAGQSNGDLMRDALQRQRLGSGETTVTLNDGTVRALFTQDQVNAAAAPLVQAVAGNLSADAQAIVAQDAQNQITRDAYANVTNGAPAGQLVGLTNDAVSVAGMSAGVQAGLLNTTAQLENQAAQFVSSTENINIQIETPEQKTAREINDIRDNGAVSRGASYDPNAGTVANFVNFIKDVAADYGDGFNAAQANGAGIAGSINAGSGTSDLANVAVNVLPGTSQVVAVSRLADGPELSLQSAGDVLNIVGTVLPVGAGVSAVLRTAGVEANAFNAALNVANNSVLVAGAGMGAFGVTEGVIDSVDGNGNVDGWKLAGAAANALAATAGSVVGPRGDTGNAPRVSDSPGAVSTLQHIDTGGITIPRVDVGSATPEVSPAGSYSQTSADPVTVTPTGASPHVPLSESPGAAPASSSGTGVSAAESLRNFDPVAYENSVQNAVTDLQTRLGGDVPGSEVINVSTHVRGSEGLAVVNGWEPRVILNGAEPVGPDRLSMVLAHEGGHIDDAYLTALSPGMQLANHLYATTSPASAVDKAPVAGVYRDASGTEDKSWGITVAENEKALQYALVSGDAEMATRLGFQQVVDTNQAQQMIADHRSIIESMQNAIAAEAGTILISQDPKYQNHLRVQESAGQIFEDVAAQVQNGETIDPANVADPRIDQVKVADLQIRLETETDPNVRKDLRAELYRAEHPLGGTASMPNSAARLDVYRLEFEHNGRQLVTELPFPDGLTEAQVRARLPELLQQMDQHSAQIQADVAAVQNRTTDFVQMADQLAESSHGLSVADLHTARVQISNGDIPGDGTKELNTILRTGLGFESEVNIAFNSSESVTMTVGDVLQNVADQTIQSIEQVTVETVVPRSELEVFKPKVLTTESLREGALSNPTAIEPIASPAVVEPQVVEPQVAPPAERPPISADDLYRAMTGMEPPARTDVPPAIQIDLQDVTPRIGSTAEVAVGSVLVDANLPGKLLVEDRLGTGSRGAVYSVTQEGVAEPMAIKIANNMYSRSHLLEEVQSAQIIEAAGIPTTRTIASDPKGNYILMERVDGPSGDAVNRDGFTTEQAQSLADIYVKAKEAQVSLDLKPSVLTWVPERHSFVVIDRGLSPQAGSQVLFDQAYWERAFLDGAQNADALIVFRQAVRDIQNIP